MAKCKECENKIEHCEDCGKPIFDKKVPYNFKQDENNKHFCGEKTAVERINDARAELGKKPLSEKEARAVRINSI